MCGFAGFVGSPDQALLELMGGAVLHRGPDQDGSFVSDACSMVHKRLAIIDLSEAGRQPMASPDGRFTVAYNGEIYNYRALRKKYESEGWKFQTQTDTECLLASASLHGLRDLAEFHGMFAFALWDRDERKLFFARDRLGIKPLFIADVDGRFGFGSEIPALLPLKPKWQMDETARALYLAVGYVSGPRTMFRGIQSAQPGTLFCYQNKIVSEMIAFGETASGPATRHADAKAELVRRVDDAVADQMVSDRPVGIFLSGGLDSSVVLSSMRKHQPSGTIKSFTTRFKHHVDDPKFNEDADLAKRTAQQYGCEHQEIEVGAEDVMHEAEAMALRLGQPHNNSATVAVDAAARLASTHVPVVLSGDGGDELFGGYYRYRLWSWAGPWLVSSAGRGLARAVSRLHPKAEAWRNLLAGKTEASRLLSFHALPSSIRTELFSSASDDEPILALWKLVLQETAFRDPVSRFMALDRATWLRDDAFVRSDRLTMRHGLELRVPLLDDALIAFATGLPQSLLVDAFQSKKIWRRAFADRCLPEVTAGKKRGWITPAAKWLRVGLTDWAREILEEAIREHAWLNGPALRRTFEDHLASRRYGLIEIWTVIQYQLWWRNYRQYFVETMTIV